MNIIYSPSGIVDFKHPAQGLTDISKAGFQNISLDISLCCTGFDLENFGKEEKPSYNVLCRDNLIGAKGNAENILPRNALSKSSERVSSIRTPEAMLQHLEPFLAQCRSHALSIQLVRLPHLQWDTKRTDLNPLLEQIAESAIHLCGKIGCPYLIVPPLFSDIEKGMEWAVNRDYYLCLAKTAQEYHVTLLLKNQCRSYNGHLIQGICSDSAEAAEWIDRLNAEAADRIDRLNAEAAGRVDRLNAEATERIDRLDTEAAEQIDRLNAEAAEQIDRLNAEAAGQINQANSNSARQMPQPDSAPTAGAPAFAFCLDTGICTLCGQDMQEFAVTLGSRLQLVLLRDCGRPQESSLLPFTAAYQGQPQTDWLSLIRGLRSIDFNGSLLLDFEDTASAFSPLLRPQLLPLASSVADYFKWQIELESLLKKYGSIVLFGAGNMCRNYMKCYGQQYPPLFTCDNNQAVWGTRFCGLEVKPPEALKELPDDCGIFICNIYYREIEKQLLEMGVPNIEFFNDEYMPSFHFDRLEV